MKIGLIASEATPFAKTGGLADVAAALGKYLNLAGHDARLILPLYAQVQRSHSGLQRVAHLQDIAVALGPHRYRFDGWTARLPGAEATVYLLDCPALYARSGLYTQDADEHLRFLALTRAAFACFQRLGFAPDILHCNDWHTAFGPLFLRASHARDPLFARTRSVLTIHNLGFQGTFAASEADALDLGTRSHLLDPGDLRTGYVNALRHGILYADAVTTVSPTYAREICTDARGMGLQETLRQRGDALVGILNGVDYHEWDPRVDPWLPLHFDPARLGTKAELKGRFLARMGLIAGARTPLLGIVSRFTAQKGLDLLFDPLPELLASRDALLVALGSGESLYEEFFAGLQQRFPGRVAFHRGYSDELAHWIEAASDIFLMPSQYEPCGLNQMYSLRYGTVPIVHRTGGLADSVQLYDPATGSGTGIVFDHFDAPAMRWALATALDLYAQPDTWEHIMRNGMAQDFSWEKQIGEYVRLYERLIS
ncbi:MAG: glycogen synthase [Gammaproteobacteria bacterium]|nr:glycogen synthase [Gammaproteobacteria bacterium]